MAQKIQISDFLVNKYNSSIIFVDSGKKKFRVGTFSRGARATANIHIFFWPNVTSKFIINLKWRKCKNFFKPLIKGNIKKVQPVSKLGHNKNEIKVFPKIRMKAKGTSWKWNMKNNFMARHCNNTTLLDGVSFEQPKEFQITLSLWVQFSETVAKIYFLSWNSLNYPA